MIINRSCEYGKKNEEMRKKLKKQGFVSSVEISGNLNYYGFYKDTIHPYIEPSKLFREMKKYCENSKDFDCIRLNIDGTIKYWYREDQVKELIHLIKMKNHKND